MPHALFVAGVCMSVCLSVLSVSAGKLNRDVGNGSSSKTRSLGRGRVWRCSLSPRRVPRHRQLPPHSHWAPGGFGGAGVPASRHYKASLTVVTKGNKRHLPTKRLGRKKSQIPFFFPHVPGIQLLGALAWGTPDLFSSQRFLWLLTYVCPFSCGLTRLHNEGFSPSLLKTRASLSVE